MGERVEGVWFWCALHQALGTSADVERPSIVAGRDPQQVVPETTLVKCLGEIADNVVQTGDHGVVKPAILIVDERVAFDVNIGNLEPKSRNGEKTTNSSTGRGSAFAL